MANRPAPALGLREGDRGELVRLTRASSGRAGLAQRARIVLLSAEGSSNTAIAAQVGISRPTVIGWRERYERAGLAGLEDQARSGRPRTVDHRQIVAATLTPPPRRYAVTHWASRLLAAHLGIGDATVARAWREYRVQPWRAVAPVRRSRWSSRLRPAAAAPRGPSKPPGPGSPRCGPAHACADAGGWRSATPRPAGFASG